MPAICGSEYSIAAMGRSYNSVLSSANSSSSFFS